MIHQRLAHTHWLSSQCYAFTKGQLRDSVGLHPTQNGVCLEGGAEYVNSGLKLFGVMAEEQKAERHSFSLAEVLQSGC